MKNNFFLVIGILGLCLLLGHNSYAANLLKNPGFEQGKFPPEEWSDWSGSGDENPNNGIAGFPTPVELAHSGDKAVGKIFYGTGERWGGYSQTIDITSTGTFIASGWVMNRKTDVALGNGAKVFIEVKFLDESEAEIRKTKSSSITRPTEWTKLTARGIIPGQTRKAVLSFVVLGGKKARGKVLFDDAVLEIK
ncbi:MAG: hypothetical protein ISS26_00360 [Candidatus Omnitrophica bacterium]|nr:hypothetical protein [Candidatus Omnitrophota bacterium]